MMQHLKTSFQYIRRAPFQALAAISVLALTFFVATLATIAVFSSNNVLLYFETRPQVIAFLKSDTADEDIDSLRSALSSDQRIKDVKLVTKEEAVEIYKKATIDNPLLGELVSPSIFPASIEFSLTNLSFANEVIEAVKSKEFVESVGFTASLGGESSLDEVLERLKSITYYIRLGGVLSIVILAFTSFLVLMVVVGMRIQTRKGEIETLSLIGATRGFIRAPIVLEAINYAVLGVIIGWVLGVTAILYSTPSILSYFGEVPILPRDTLVFFGLLFSVLGAEIVVGILIALLGSMIAVSRALSSK